MSRLHNQLKETQEQQDVEEDIFDYLEDGDVEEVVKKSKVRNYEHTGALKVFIVSLLLIGLLFSCGFMYLAIFKKRKKKSRAAAYNNVKVYKSNDSGSFKNNTSDQSNLSTIKEMKSEQEEFRIVPKRNDAVDIKNEVKASEEIDVDEKLSLQANNLSFETNESKVLDQLEETDAGKDKQVENGIVEFLNNLRINSIRIDGMLSRIKIGKEVYYLNSVINKKFQLRLVDIGKAQLTFADESGTFYSKSLIQ